MARTSRTPVPATWSTSVSYTHLDVYKRQRLDVGEHLLEVAHARGKGLHLAEALIDLLEPLAHQLEASPC